MLFFILRNSADIHRTDNPLPRAAGALVRVTPASFKEAPISKPPNVTDSSKYGSSASIASWSRYMRSPALVAKFLAAPRPVKPGIPCIERVDINQDNSRSLHSDAVARNEVRASASVLIYFTLHGAGVCGAISGVG